LYLPLNPRVGIWIFKWKPDLPIFDAHLNAVNRSAALTPFGSALASANASDATVTMVRI